MKSIKSVDDYIAKSEWKQELTVLRDIILQTNLIETVKWGASIYTCNGKNLVGIGAFKNYVGLWFFQGALLKDTGNNLINAQEGKTKALRQWRFAHMDDIDPKLIHDYVEESMTNQKLGKVIKPQRKPLVVPAELKIALNENNLEEIYNLLNLTNKRDFTGYILEAKRPETKQKRIDKIIPMIRKGIGLNDKYK